MKRIRVERHTTLFRILHWLIFAEGLLLGLTGAQLSGIGGLQVFPEATRALHVVTGLAFTATAIFFFYYFVVSGDYRWYGLRRIPYSLRFMVAEARAWFGIGPHIEEPIRYDPKRREYVEKIVPTEAMVWWIYFALGVLIIITGAALAFPDKLAIVYDIAGYLSPLLGGGPYAVLRAIHRLVALLIFGVVILHAYAAWVFGMLRAITLGHRDEPVAE